MTPILNDRSLEFVSRSAEQTRRLGARLGDLLRGGEVVCLQGSLGAGKTVLAQGVGRGWGATQPLVSPSFVLMRHHHRPTRDQVLIHVDFYRIQRAEEAEGLGLEDWIEAPDVVTVIEWPERAAALLPRERLWIRFKFAGESRRQLLFTAEGASYEELLQDFRRSAFGG
jgi:tRNA threonylcarbamoyladenosine biosynthesis protein TsaE